MTRPGKNLPRDCMIILSDDGKFMLIGRQKNRPKPFLYLADGNGRIIREITLKSMSPDPAKDCMGGLRLYKDQDGNYFFRYSFNKAASRSPNPHQGWTADLEGNTFVPATAETGNLQEGIVVNGKRRFLRMAGRDPLAPSLGHAGMSPSERYLVGRNKTPFICLTDLQTHDQRYLAYVPSADHIDWSAKVEWFLTRTRTQPGLPIYRVDVPSGVAHRIVATNTDDHLACFSYSHPSPDGTNSLKRKPEP